MAGDTAAAVQAFLRACKKAGVAVSVSVPKRTVHLRCLNGKVVPPDLQTQAASFKIPLLQHFRRQANVRSSGANRAAPDDVPPGPEPPEPDPTAGTENGGPQTGNGEVRGTRTADVPPHIQRLLHRRPWPHPMAQEAFYGIPGRIVETIAPETEADPALIFTFLLSALGNLIHRTPYFQVGPTRHYANVYAAGVGPTATGRKDTALDWARGICAQMAPEWQHTCCVSGLSSGEGLVEAVRDPSDELNAKTGEPLERGVLDKRLLVMESELSRLLRVMMREASTLSAIIRDAFDGKHHLGVITRRQSRIKATAAHITIVANTTEEDLRRYLTEVDMANGFANRFVWVCARRTQALPFGGADLTAALAPHLEALQQAIERARLLARIEFAPDARAVWPAMYEELSAERPGLLGAVTNRAAVMVRRIALLHTALDGCDHTELRHLLAARAAWDYYFASAQYLFGHRTGDMVADALVQILAAAGRAGVTRSEISRYFSGHEPQARIDAALVLLAEMGIVRYRTDPSTGGRPAERWVIAEPGSAKKAKNAQATV
jgi:hypothetical protein